MGGSRRRRRRLVVIQMHTARGAIHRPTIHDPSITLNDGRAVHGHQVRKPLGAAQKPHPGVEHERHGCFD